MLFQGTRTRHDDDDDDAKLLSLSFVCEGDLILVHYSLLQPTNDDAITNGQDESNWECDLQHVRELMRLWGHRVEGLVVNNPDNPTGAVFSKAHLCEIVHFCDEHQLPVVAWRMKYMVT